MNQESQVRWINEVLNEVFLAMVASEPLRQAVIFKGARVLSLHLGESRQSLDLDGNVAPELAASFPGAEEQARFLEDHLPRALNRYFERQNPVKFKLAGLKVDHRPPEDHPRGWNAFLLRIQIQDNRLTGVKGLPRLEMDVAAPESLGPDAVEVFSVGGFPARIYALHRIAGEKLRAYLTSLPAYRRKMSGGAREFRVKDLHDLARILQRHPASDREFWEKSGREFRLACKSRLVDCSGLESFMENWPLARERYQTDASLKQVPFTEAEQALKTIAGLIKKQGGFPLYFPIR